MLTRKRTRFNGFRHEEITEVLTPEEETAVRAEWAKAEAEKSARAWLDGRIGPNGYKSIPEQLDMIATGLLALPTNNPIRVALKTWLDHVADVKGRFPKPEGA